MNTTIYHFDPITCEYLGQSEADESPLEPGVLLLPAHVTRHAPPPTGERETAVFDAEANAWLVMPDYRAIDLYSVHDGSPVAVADLGPQPPDTTDHPRPTPFHEWNGFLWTPNLERIKADKWESIKAERDRRSEAGCRVAGQWFHNNLKSRTQWERMANRATTLVDADPYLVDGEQVAWKTMSGAYVPLTAGLIRQVVDAFEVQEVATFKAAETHRAKMEAAADPSAYDYAGDWPDIYSAVTVA